MSTEPETNPIIQTIGELSQGNVGAMNAITMLIALSPQIHPEAEFGIFTTTKILHDFDITGSDIWIVFKDICGGDPIKMTALLYALHDEYIPATTILSAMQVRYGAGTPIGEVKLQLILKHTRDKWPSFIAHGVELQEPEQYAKDGMDDGKDGTASEAV